LRKSPLYILTEDLSFFYKINKELNKLKIPFKILSVNKIIPKYSAIILTKSNELINWQENEKNSVILAYSDNDDFNHYLIKVIAAYRVGYKEKYSELLFSVDPGKKTGLMIFLDGLYLYSYCCFEISEVLGKIKQYINCFQENNPTLISLTFKLGNGVLPITINLVDKIYLIYDGRENLKIFLIDEFKSSKIKANQKNRTHQISKDELSALVLALRRGIEVNQENYINILNQLRSNKKRKDNRAPIKNQNANYDKSFLGEIALKVIDGELTLEGAFEELKSINSLK